MRRALFPAALALLAAAGCGGEQRSTLGGGAALLPANTVAFVAARTDTKEDWRAFARSLLHRAVDPAPKDADEIDLAVLQGGRLVVLTHANGKWSSATHPHPSLAEAPNYEQSLRSVADGAVAQGYLRGDVAAQRLVALPGQTVTSTAVFGSRFRVIRHPLTVPTIAVLRYRWGAAWLTGSGIGARAHSAGPPLAKSHRVRSIEQLAGAYAPALFDEIPADAIAVLDVPLGPGSFELVPRLPPQLTGFFAADLGPSLPSLLDAIFQGETAVYLRRGGEVTFVTSPADLGDAEAALSQLGPIRGLAPLHRAEIGGQLVLSTTRRGIDAFRGGGPKLSADERFRKAGFPERVTALAYVTPEGARVLESRPLVAYASADGQDPTVTVRFVAAAR